MQADLVKSIEVPRCDNKEECLDRVKEMLDARPTQILVWGLFTV